VFRGLLTSFIGHALLLAYALFSIQRTPQLPETVAIEATLITPAELTRLKQGNPDSKELEAKAKEEPKPEVSKKEAEKPKPVTEPPPPPPPPPEEPMKTEEAKPKEDAISQKLAALPAPESGPTPQEKKLLEDKLEEERQAAEKLKKEELKKEEELKTEEERKKAEAKKKEEEKKKAEAKRKAEERKKKLAEAKRKAEEAKKKQFDPDRIAALIDKSPDKRGAPRTSTQPTKPTEYTGPTAGERQGTDTVLTAREQDMLKAMINSQLQPCAKMPGGGGGIDTPVVSVEFRLRQDGSLEGEPVLVAPQSSPLYNLAAEASIRAVKQCAPFQLPPDKYGAWSRVTWEFDWPVILGLVQR
jgi:colicin import membrane protein